MIINPSQTLTIPRKQSQYSVYPGSVIIIIITVSESQTINVTVTDCANNTLQHT